MTKKSSSIISIALVTGMLSAGCGGSAPHPTETLQSYSDAVRSKDSDAVYALLDDSTRMGLDQEAFAAYFDEHYDEILEEAEALDAHNRTDAIDVRAEVDVGEGRVARLTYREGQWRLADPQPVAVGQQTPREAIDALVAALDESNFDLILSLLSTDRRSIYVGELEALRKSIEEGLKEGIVTRGNRAILPLAGGARIILVREGDAWKITELHQGNK